MLDKVKRSMSELLQDLPKTWGSPTMSPHCADEAKYRVVDAVTGIYEFHFRAGKTIANQRIKSLSTVNGVRITLEDDTWGLIRASSNKPELVIVCESPTSEEMMKIMFAHIDKELSAFPEVGFYNQKLK